MDQVVTSQMAPSSRTPPSPTSSSSVTAASSSTATSSTTKRPRSPRSETAAYSTTAASTVSPSRKRPSSTSVRSAQHRYKRPISTTSVKKNLQGEPSSLSTLRRKAPASPTGTETLLSNPVYTDHRQLPLLLTRQRIYHLQYRMIRPVLRVISSNKNSVPLCASHTQNSVQICTTYTFAHK